MKFSVKIMMMTIVLISIVTSINAQTKKGKNIEERVERKTAHLQKELGLNDSQTNEINEIGLAYAQKTASIKDAAHTQKEAGKEIDKEAIREQVKKIREAQTSEIKAILTPEQVTKFETIVKEHKARKGKKGKNLEERVEYKTARLQKELGLNATQTNKISEISLAYAQKAKFTKDAARAQKKAGKEVDREAIREQMKKIREAQTSEIKAVLTPEQVTKFEVMVKEHKAKKGKKGGKNTKERIERKAAHLQNELKLNDKQTSEIKKISLVHAEKIQAIRQTTKTQKEAGKQIDKDAVREQIKTVKAEQDTAIKAVLTPEQVTKFEEMTKEHRAKKEQEGKRKNDK